MGAEESRLVSELEEDDKQIIVRLSECYKDNYKNFSILLALLTDEQVIRSRDTSTIWILFRSLISSGVPNETIMKVCEDQINLAMVNNPRILTYVIAMADVIVEKKPEESLEDWYKKCSGVIATSKEKTLQLWKYVPTEAQKSLWSTLTEMKQKFQSEAFLDLVRENPKICIAFVAAALVAAPATLSIYKWYNGEISGKRCAKNISQVSATVGGGLAGGYAGTIAVTAACTNPITGAVVVGGIIGCLLAAIATSYAADKLLAYILSLPKDEALEKAYDFIGVKCTASDREVNAAIARKLIETRPKGDGPQSLEAQEAFSKATLYAGVIKISRGWAPEQLAIEGPKA